MQGSVPPQPGTPRCTRAPGPWAAPSLARSASHRGQPAGPESSWYRVIAILGELGEKLQEPLSGAWGPGGNRAEKGCVGRDSSSEVTSAAENQGRKAGGTAALCAPSRCRRPASAQTHAARAFAHFGFPEIRFASGFVRARTGAFTCRLPMSAVRAHRLSSLPWLLGNTSSFAPRPRACVALC